MRPKNVLGMKRERERAKSFNKLNLGFVINNKACMEALKPIFFLTKQVTRPENSLLTFKNFNLITVKQSSLTGNVFTVFMQIL